MVVLERAGVAGGRTRSERRSRAVAERRSVPLGAGLKRSLGRPALYVVIALWMVCTLGPYVVMAVTSVTPQDQLIAYGMSRLPTHFSVQGYSELFATTPFVHYMVNSAITALGTVLFSLVVASAAAISLSRFRFRGRTTVLTALLVAQLFPAVLLVIPLSTMLRSGHLLNSRRRSPPTCSRDSSTGCPRSWTRRRRSTAAARCRWCGTSSCRCCGRA